MKKILSMGYYMALAGWQYHMKLRSLAFFSLCPDLAIVIIDHFFTQCEANSRSRVQLFVVQALKKPEKM